MGRRPFKCYRYQKNKPYPKSRFNRGVPGKPQHLSGGNLKQFIPLLCSRSLSLLCVWLASALSVSSHPI